MPTELPAAGRVPSQIPRLPPGAPALAEFGTSETTALTTSGAQSPVFWDPHYGSKTPEYLNWTFGLERQLTSNMSISISYVGSEGHFLSVSKAIGKRNNELPESFAALAGYNLSGSTATACSGAGLHRTVAHTELGHVGHRPHGQHQPGHRTRLHAAQPLRWQHLLLPNNVSSLHDQLPAVQRRQRYHQFCGQ